jgi:uncharacterized protein DUF5995
MTPRQPADPAPVADIAAVVARMEAIEAATPGADGVARFNHLYLAVTREVLAETDGAGFEDLTFLSRLDVSFAELYFAAGDAVDQGRQPARAWAPLYEQRARTDVAPIQFALAGMNAHINFDLCLALVATCDDLGIKLDSDSPQRRDYERVNTILERVEERVKGDLEDELLRAADEALGRVDDVVAMWSVGRARDAAWTHAEVLSALAGIPPLRDEYLTTLGRFVGLAGRGFLVPTL